VEKVLVEPLNAEFGMRIAEFEEMAGGGSQISDAAESGDVEIGCTLSHL
jgi:GR25 family glycosyltransferase involved in LPS biosynthesis